MTNLKKMVELTGHDVPKEKVMEWAYMNRVWVIDLEDHEPFEVMKNSVDHWIDNNDYKGDEHENWDRFLDAEYVEATDAITSHGN